jgi:SAM-dependent methyltransferase
MHSDKAERLFAWWWWRSPNRPHVIDNTYISLLDQLPSEAVGLDLGSRSKVRKNALTVDIIPAQGVDVVADGQALPFPNDTFDYVWCNAVLEHVPYPMKVASEIGRILKPAGLAFIQVPFLENIHGWPEDYYRFTLQGLRVLFNELEEIKSGVSAGPGQVLPDLIQYYSVFFAELQKGSLLPNLFCLIPGFLLLPVRLLDHLIKKRPSYWKWARAYYWVGRKPVLSDLSLKVTSKVSPSFQSG